MTRSSNRLSLEQKLQQRLVPQQVMFVKLLEMSGPEVEEEVRRELDDNPALEKVDPDPEASIDNDTPSYMLHARNSSSDDSVYEPVAVADTDTLQESLTRQLDETDMTDRDRTIAVYIIGNIDNNGYLTRDLGLIINDMGLQEDIDVSRQEAQRVFDTIRRLDPPGTGAIDLRDCLLLQLHRHPMAGTQEVDDATEIVANYFDLFSKRHFDRLCAAMSISRERLQRASGIITSLNPKPGSAISAESSDRQSHTVIPDFTVDTDGDMITVSLVNSIPELRIERSFTVSDEEIRESAADRRNSTASAFIRQKRDDANSFIRMLRMRQETLYKVMKAIVDIQQAFFLNGDDESRIRPMILKDIATRTGIELSVISRATMGKWVATPHGVYPLKMFFNERVRDDDDTSSHEILAAIRHIIDTEDKSHPLSDNTITERLGEMGYELARRTVAKYRERLGLPVARLRRGL